MSVQEAQKYRMRVPEPTHCNLHFVMFMIERPLPVIFGDGYDFSTAASDTNIGQFERMLLTDKNTGTKFWAWTVNGGEPVFPIPTA